jgi:hypothetical protein
MISVTTTMVMAVQRQRSCGVSGLLEMASTIGFETRRRFQNLERIKIFKTILLLNGLSSLMICTHDLTVLTKTKGTACYCESFGYGGATLSQTFLTI